MKVPRVGVVETVQSGFVSRESLEDPWLKQIKGATVLDHRIQDTWRNFTFVRFSSAGQNGKMLENGKYFKDLKEQNVHCIYVFFILRLFQSDHIKF